MAVTVARGLHNQEPKGSEVPGFAGSAGRPTPRSVRVAGCPNRPSIFPGGRALAGCAASARCDSKSPFRFPPLLSSPTAASGARIHGRDRRLPGHPLQPFHRR